MLASTVRYQGAAYSMTSNPELISVLGDRDLRGVIPDTTLESSPSSPGPLTEADDLLEKLLLGILGVQLGRQSPAQSPNFNVTSRLFSEGSLNNLNLTNTPFSLSGRVDAPLYGGTMDSTVVTVYYSGGSVQTYSDRDGYYSFLNIPSGAIEVSAKLPMQSTERVTTYDIFRVGQHLLGIQPFENPLILLAADVNKSGNISAFDITAIRRVILGQDLAFAGEHEAATLGAYHPFSDEKDPWADANAWGTHFPYVNEDITSNDISVVKLGDVNPNNHLRPRGASQLVVEDSYVKRGETVEILVRNDYQSAVAGLQVAVQADGRLEIYAADENIDLHSNTINGSTRVSIIQEMLPGEPIMTWTFTPNQTGMLSDLIRISSDIPNESYGVENYQPAQLALQWDGQNMSRNVAEISAFPNPFDNHLSICAHLTKEGKHVLHVLDMTGRRFAERRIDVTEDSWHNLLLQTDKWPAGVYILSLEGPTGRLTQRVVLALT